MEPILRSCSILSKAGSSLSSEVTNLYRVLIEPIVIQFPPNLDEPA